MGGWKDGRMEEVKDGRIEVALNGWDSHLYNPLSLRECLASETRLELPGLVLRNFSACTHARMRSGRGKGEENTSRQVFVSQPGMLG